MATMASGWDLHKETLRTLYLTRKLRLTDIIDEMKDRHGFVKSKGQYERQFKKWDFRKNSTGVAWKIVVGKVEKRQKHGKASAVYQQGRKLEVAKLVKERRHDFQASGELDQAHKDDPQTPEGFTVCTPMAKADTAPFIYMNNLPSLLLFNQLRSLVPHQPASGLSTTNCRSTQLSVVGDHWNDGSDIVEFVPRATGTVLDGAPTAMHDEQTIDPIDHDPTELLDMVLSGTWKPETHNLRQIFHVSSTDGIPHHLLPALHLASNNLLNEQQASDLWNLILEGTNRNILNVLVSTPSPATKAIARTLLPSAIESSEVSLTKSLLQTGIDVNTRLDLSAQTPLDVAVAGGSTELVQLLLSYGASVDKPAYYGTHLQHAAQEDTSDLVQILLQAGADVNAPPLRTSGMVGTALQQAAFIGNLEIVQILVAAGAHINAPAFRNGYTALEAALQRALRGGACAPLVQWLLSNGAHVNASVLRVAALAAESEGDLELLQMVLTSGQVDVTAALEAAASVQWTDIAEFILSVSDITTIFYNGALLQIALRAVAGCGAIQLMQSFLDLGATFRAPDNDDDACWTAALQTAALRGHTDMVQLLLDFGVDINAPPVAKSGGMTALQAAAWINDTKLARFLLHSGADVHAYASLDDDGGSVLERAASWRNLELTHLLLDSGMDDMRHRVLALWTAVRRSSVKIVRVLLDYGTPMSKADVNYNIHYNETVLAIAASGTDNAKALEITRLLLSAGADSVSAALPFAAERGNLELVELLLRYGADINAVDRYDVTALKHATFRAHVPMVSLLLEYGANETERTGALAQAAWINNLELVRLLRDWKAVVNLVSWVFTGDSFEHRTPLQAAVCNGGSLQLVRLLLDAGAKVENGPECTGEEATALQYAAMEGSISLFNELVQRGADVNAPAKGPFGRTALEGAAENGRLDIVQLLINLQADVRGSRAVGLARKEGHDGVVELLLKLGCEDMGDSSDDEDSADDEDTSDNESE